MFSRILRSALLVLAAVAIAACQRAAAPDRPPVIIVVADALRHDYASLPDYTPDPRGFSRLAATSTVFLKCVTTMPMTRGSFPGLLSGEMTGTLDENARRQSWVQSMRAAGYRTTFIASSFAFGKDPSSVDIAPLFNEVFLENTPGRIARPMPEAVDLLDQVLAHRKNDRVLIVVHLFYPHAPYWKSSYGASVTELDHQIARVLDVLQRRGVYESAHVIVTSDHGESLQEHDSPPQHGWNVYGEQTRVPLLWKAPHQHERHVVDDLVRNFDIGPTLVDLLSLRNRIPHSIRSGVPIAAMTGGFSEPEVAFHTALASRTYPVPQIAIRTNRYLMVQNSEGVPSTELYDYDRDPAELYNVAATESGRRIIHDLEPRLAELKQAWINTAIEQREGLSPEMRQTLQSLGYLGTGPSTSQPQSPLQTSPLPGVNVRFRECFSARWGRYAGDTYDALFPVRLVFGGDEMYVISNATRDLSRLHSTAGRVRAASLHGSEYDEVWFQHRNYELAPQSKTLLALLDGRKLRRYFVNANDYRIDAVGSTFSEDVAQLDRPYTDLADAPGLGTVLFTNDAVYLRHDDGRVAVLGHYASDAFRTAVDDQGNVFVAVGETIFRFKEGRPPEIVVPRVGAPILALALRGRELWAGTASSPPTPATDRNPIMIYNADTGRQIGTFGSRLLHETNSFWSAVDVGPFGIAAPRQIVFHGDRLYVLDSGLERILSFDVF